MQCCPSRAAHTPEKTSPRFENKNVAAMMLFDHWDKLMAKQSLLSSLIRSYTMKHYASLLKL
jgi:hypothetical protein